MWLAAQRGLAGEEEAQALTEVGQDAVGLRFGNAQVVQSETVAVGVVLGVITAMISFARRVAHITHVERIEGPDPATNT